jgi:hypothetical protein
MQVAAKTSKVGKIRNLQKSTFAEELEKNGEHMKKATNARRIDLKRKTIHVGRFRSKGGREEVRSPV